MIPALNELRRTLGLPTVPTLTGRRRASVACRKEWLATLREAVRLETAPRGGMMWRYRDLAACPDHLFGEPDAEQRGRRARMAEAVARGFEGAGWGTYASTSATPMFINYPITEGT